MAFKCDLCATICTEKRSLKSHYERKHGKVPDSFYQLPNEAAPMLPCSYCGSQFSKGNLPRHQMTCKSRPAASGGGASLSRDARQRYRSLVTSSQSEDGAARPAGSANCATGEEELLDKFHNWLVAKGLARKTIQFHMCSMANWLSFIKEPKWVAEEEMLAKAFNGYGDFLGKLSNENAREDASATYGNFVSYLREHHKLELDADHDTVSQLLVKYFASDKRRALMDHLSGKGGRLQAPMGFSAKQLRCFVMGEVILATGSTGFVRETTLAEFNAGKARELPESVRAAVQEYVLVHRADVVGQHHRNKGDLAIFALNHDKVWKVCEDGLWEAVQDMTGSVTRLNTKRVLQAEYQYPA